MADYTYASGEINITFGTTRGIAAQLISASEAVDTILENLQAEVNKWANTCVGMDKGQFDALFAEWNQYADQAALYVKEHGRLLDDISESYDVMDRQLAANWGNLSPLA
jgi:uncharacterized protein YukE